LQRAGFAPPDAGPAYSEPRLVRALPPRSRSISKGKISRFKCYDDTFTLDLNADLNVIVGATNPERPTLEAIHLALTGLLHADRYATT
jgi:hypothetical protein